MNERCVSYGVDDMNERCVSYGVDDMNERCVSYGVDDMNERCVSYGVDDMNERCVSYGVDDMNERCVSYGVDDMNEVHNSLRMSVVHKKLKVTALIFVKLTERMFGLCSFIQSREHMMKSGLTHLERDYKLYREI